MQLFISDSLNPDFYAGMFCKNFLMETRSIRYLIKLNKWHDLHDVIFVFCFFSYHFESIKLPENLALEGICGGMLKAWEIYGQPK